MKDLIKQYLDEYIEFDSDIIFNNTDYAVVFGGSLRDIVAGESHFIKDIDIMCLPISKRRIHNILLEQGYKKYDLFSPDIFLLYSQIKCIFEPKTFIKGNKIVQLISPTVRNGIVDFNSLKNNFFKILINVDLSSSGLVYDGKLLYESVKNSTEHCKHKIFLEIKDAEMYNKDRIIIRKNNLLAKGWKEFRRTDNIELRYEKIMTIRNKSLTIDDLKYNIGKNEIQKGRHDNLYK